MADAQKRSVLSLLAGTRSKPTLVSSFTCLFATRLKGTRRGLAALTGNLLLLVAIHACEATLPAVVGGLIKLAKPTRATERSEVWIGNGGMVG